MPAPFDHAGAFPRRVLLAVTGLSPQIVTETLYALAVKGSWIPTERHEIASGGSAPAVPTVSHRKDRARVIEGGAFAGSTRPTITPGHEAVAKRQRRARALAAGEWFSNGGISRPSCPGCALGWGAGFAPRSRYWQAPARSTRRGAGTA
jgi:hypothetical protein